MSEIPAVAQAVEAHVLHHAERVGDEIGFWRVRVPPGETLSRVHIYAHHRGHWHYVSDGLWSLGIELTYRVPREGDTPLPGPIDLLRRIAHGIVTYRQLPSAKDTMTFEPALAPGSNLTAIAFVRDPELGVVQVPGGRVDLLQCVGITAGEARACVRTSTENVVDRLTAADRYLVTRHDRAELPGLPAESANAVSRGHTVPTLRWIRDPGQPRHAVWIEPSRMRPTFAEHLVSRIESGTFFRVRGPDRVIRFEPGSTPTAEEIVFEGLPTLLVRLDAAALAEVVRSAASEDPLRVGVCDIHFVDEP